MMILEFHCILYIIIWMFIGMRACIESPVEPHERPCLIIARWVACFYPRLSEFELSALSYSCRFDAWIYIPVSVVNRAKKVFDLLYSSDCFVTKYVLSDYYWITTDLLQVSRFKKISSSNWSAAQQCEIQLLSSYS